MREMVHADVRLLWVRLRFAPSKRRPCRSRRRHGLRALRQREQTRLMSGRRFTAPSHQTDRFVKHVAVAEDPRNWISRTMSWLAGNGMSSVPSVPICTIVPPGRTRSNACRKAGGAPDASKITSKPSPVSSRTCSGTILRRRIERERPRPGRAPSCAARRRCRSAPSVLRRRLAR